LAALARERVEAVFRVSGASHGVAETHAKAWARLTRARAGVICELTCGGFCDDARVIVIVSVNEIGHRMQRVW
jgi:hypothetical protein